MTIPPHRRCFSATLLFLIVSAVAIDECPRQDESSSCICVPPIRNYNDFKTAVEAAGPGDKLCFSDFHLMLGDEAKPTIIKGDVHVQCSNANSCVFEGGEIVIKIMGNNAKATIQGFTFMRATEQAIISIGTRHKQKVCHCNFIRNISTKGRGAAMRLGYKTKAFVGHCAFWKNENKRQGGAIYNMGALALHNSNFEQNSARKGGAIMSKAHGTLEVDNCTFSGNKALTGPAVRIEGGFGAVRNNYGAVATENFATDNVGCNGISYSGYSCIEFDSLTQPSTPIQEQNKSPNEQLKVWQTNPLPNEVPEGYFNYDPSDLDYGPSAWKHLPAKETQEYKYWQEFEHDGMPERINLSRNYCGEKTFINGLYVQSPIDVNDADAQGTCDEVHQVRHEPGHYRLDNADISGGEGAVEMQILPSKLRIKWPRAFDKSKCPNRGTEYKCPPSADIPWMWGSHLPVIHADFKMPSEHTLDGKRFAGEYQLFHWQSAGRGAPVVSVFLDVPEDPGDEETEAEYHNTNLEIAIRAFEKEFISQEECKARRDRKLNRVDVEDQDSALSLISTTTQTPNPSLERSGDIDVHQERRPGLRGLLSNSNDAHQPQNDAHPQDNGSFDPYHPSLLPSIWFYGYDNVALTEPPCTPLASYHVADRPMKLSTDQLSRLQEVLFAHVDMDTAGDDCSPTGVHYGGRVARPLQATDVGPRKDLHRCTCKNFFSDSFRKKTGLMDGSMSWKRAEKKLHESVEVGSPELMMDP